MFAALAVIGVGLVIFLIVARGRISHAGTYDEYHAGHALNLGEGKLGWALAATSTGVAIAIVLVGFTLWEQGKRSRS